MQRGFIMIDFKHVTYSYSAGTPVLRDVSFHIDRGERVGLIGANGAGKSTILKALTGLADIVKAGEIRVGGLVMGRDNLAEIRRIIGYVLQDSDDQMFMPTVLEDMIFGPMNYGASRSEAEAKADEVLRELGLTYLKDRHNHRISGGEKRMAAIATILAMEPEVLVMDEPSASLDPRNRRRLIGLINALPQTKLIASHDLDMILDTCDRVLLVSDGEIKADGRCAEVLRDRELLEKYGLELPLVLQKAPLL